MRASKFRSGTKYADALPMRASIRPASLDEHRLPARTVAQQCSLLEQRMLKILLANEDAGQLADRFAALAREIFLADAAVVLLTGEGHQPPVLHATSADAAEVLDLCAGQSPAATAASTGFPCDVPDVRSDDRFPQHNAGALSRNWRACFVEPLRDLSGCVFGSLSFYFVATPAVRPDSGIIGKYFGPLLATGIAARPRAVAPQASSDRFATLAAMMPGVVYQRVVTPDGNIRYTYLSEGARDLFGVSPEEVLRDPEALFRTFSDEYRRKFRQRLIAASQEMKTWDVEASFIAADGRLKYTHAIARPERLSDGSVLWTGVILDATRIKEAEAAVAATEERTRTAIVENLSQGFLLYDAGDRLLIRNSHFLELYPELSDQAVPGACYEHVIRTELSAGRAAPLTGKALEYAVQERLAKHGKAHCTHERRIGERWIQINEHRTGDGGTVVLYTDVSELRAAQDEIMRKGKLAQLGQLTATVAHEIRNPLCAVRIAASTIERKVKDQPFGLEPQLRRINNGIDRCNRIITELLDFARPSTLACTTVVVDAWVSEIVEEEKAILPPVLRISCDLGLGELTATFDTDRMRRAIINLLSNASEAMVGKGTDGKVMTTRNPMIHVATRLVDDTVEIRITDNGPGITEENLQKVLEPLFSTKAFGTGLGLPAAEKVLQLHGGGLRVESPPGMGATFIAYFPRH